MKKTEGGLMIIALLIAALNLRLAINSISPILDDFSLAIVGMIAINTLMIVVQVLAVPRQSRKGEETARSFS